MENPFDLIDQRLQAIEEKLDDLIQKTNNQDKSSSLSTTWVTTKQIAQHLGISTAAITNMRGSKIPYYKVGGRILFKREEVDEYIQKSRYLSRGDNLDEYLKRHR